MHSLPATSNMRFDHLEGRLSLAIRGRNIDIGMDVYIAHSLVWTRRSTAPSITTAHDGPTGSGTGLDSSHTSATQTFAAAETRIGDGYLKLHFLRFTTSVMRDEFASEFLLAERIHATHALLFPRWLRSFCLCLPAAAVA